MSHILEALSLMAPGVCHSLVAAFAAAPGCLPHYRPLLSFAPLRTHISVTDAPIAQFPSQDQTPEEKAIRGT